MTGAHFDPVDETRRILRAADDSGVPVRAVGGVAVAISAPSIRLLSPTRTYHDIDLVGRAPRAPIERLLGDLGYAASKRFNTLNGSDRLLFHDAGGRRVDVFLDVLRMCHELPFGDRLMVAPLTLPPADLLLTKLQIVELTDRDADDIAAVLTDHDLTDDDRGISVARIEAVCGADWGWWKTVDDNLGRLIERWGRAAVEKPGDGPLMSTAVARAGGLRSRLATVSTTLSWRLRALVGERMRWYDQPEEIR
jgi:hypothetical protein